MANVNINTRIKLKYDTLAEWTKNNPVLLAGEVAIVAIPSNSESTVGQVTKPAIVFKVGDGTTEFNTLPYASGLAADVYAWAKKASLEVADMPNITTSKITDFTTAVESIVDTAISEIPSVEIPEYTLRAGTEDGTLELVKDNVVVGTAAEVPGWAEVAAAVESLGALATKDQITNADVADGAAIAVSKIAGLGALATKDTIVEGDITGTIAHTKISGLGTAATANANTFATAAQGEKADTAVQNVSSSGSGVATGFTKSGTNIAVTLSQVTDAMVAAGANIAQSKINGLTSALSAINASIASINTDIEGLGNALHFAGAGANLPEDGEDGDVYVITSGEDAGKEYIWANGEWQEFGDTSDYLLASTAQATYVPKTTTVAGHALNTAAIEITADDVGADPAGTAQTLINGLDATISGMGAGKTLATLTQTNGVIAATFQDIKISSANVTDLGALATKDTVGDAEITGVSMGKVNGLSAALAGKQDTLTFDGTYNGSTNKVATQSTVANAIANLDKADSAQTNQYVTAVSEANGIITVTRKQIQYSEIAGTPTEKTTTFAAANGLTVSGADGGTVTYGIDLTSTFIFNCGSSSTLVDQIT